jgi:Carbohydrate family 9 binding domain-like
MLAFVLRCADLTFVIASLVMVLLIGVPRGADAQGPRRPAVDFEALTYAPRQVVCYRASTPLAIDGRPDEAAWRAVAWSEPFIDIEGDRKPRPPFRTRVKMLWDDEFFYFAAEMEEPHVWGTLTERDSVIFQDNDFEVFIDPDGDTHAYYEFEMNALNTVWDLLLIQPYRDGGPALNGWDIAGLKSAVGIRGTINQPSDRDEGWTLEIAMPWKILKEAAAGGRAPQRGDQWRVNFSRVEWQMDVKPAGGAATAASYAKRVNPATGKPFPEDNWVWSPQGAVNMHMPERWGIVQFSDVTAEASAASPTAFVEDRNDRVRWALRRLYYRQRAYQAANGRYASDLAALRASDIRVEGLEFKPALSVADSLYEIRAAGFDGAVLHLRQDGKVWVTR